MNLDWLPRDSDAMIDAATAYAANGWQVFPCAGKHPITAAGFKDAKADAEPWSKNPAANVGWALPLGWFALDVDPRHGGDKSLAELQCEHGALPLTLRARTGGGGEHWIFAVPPGVEIRQMAGFRPGLDTRLGGRGYLLIAPSIHPETKQRYRWHVTIAPVLPPAWLLDLVKAKTAPTPPVPYVPPRWSAEMDRQKRYALAALKGQCHDVSIAGKGQRNDTLNRAWWRMLKFRGALSVDEIRAALTQAGTKCGLSEIEISKVLR